MGKEGQDQEVDKGENKEEGKKIIRKFPFKTGKLNKKEREDD